LGILRQEIALACLKCLTLDDFTTGARPSEQQMRARINDVPFLRNAATYWYRHEFSPRPDSDSALSNCLSKLFNEDNQNAYYNWLRIHQPDPSNAWLGECPWLRFKDIPPVAWYTSYFKLPDLTSALQQSRGNNPEELCVMEATELAGSVRSGDIEHVKILLDRGVTIDFMTTEGQPLLMLCGT
jgi:hypothetical protein